jgi:DNA-binding transcriptional MocR family regulator
MTDPIQTTQMHVDPSMIDFGVGQPQLSLLPLDRIRAAAELRFARGDPAFLQYGAEQGDGFLRRELARYLEQTYGFPVSPTELFITNGASQGLDLICTLFTSPGDTIFIEEPSYFLALRIFADHRLNIVSLPMDSEGLIIEALEEQLKTTRPVLLYTIPTFQNPSGYTLSKARRTRLAQLSREHGFTIVADEVYHLLNFSARPSRSLAGFIDQGNILSLGSFSKILAPGLRLGWIHAAPQRTQAFAACGLLDSGGGLNPFTSGIVRGLLETDGLQENIKHLCAVFGARVAAMDAALRSELPEAAYLTPLGGYFFWVRLPGGRDAQEFLQRAEEHKVSFRPGMRFSSQGGLRDYARLCFAYYDAGQLTEGVKRLKQALA